MAKSLLLIVIFSFSFYPQSLFELYKPIIPPKTLSDEDLSDNVSTLLEEVNRYDPSWIYNFIEYLKALEKDPKDAKKRLADFNYNRNEYLKKMKAWISNEFNICTDQSVTFPQWARIYSYLLFLKSSPTDDIEADSLNYPADESFKKYIIYLFFKGTFEAYNKSAEYDVLLDKEIANITSALTDVYNNTDSYHPDKLEYYYDYAKEHPYLFKGTLLDYVKQPVTVYVTEFLIKVSAPEYLERYSVSAGIQTSQFNGQKEFSAVYSDDRFTVESNFNDINRNYISYGAAVNIGIRKYKSYLSDLDLSVFAGFSSGDLPDPEINYLGAPYYIVHNARVDPNFTAGEFTYSSQSYQLKLITPLVFFLSNLSIKGGAHFRYSIYKYNGTYNREDKYNPNWNNLGEDLLTTYTQEVEFTNEIMEIKPVITIDYILLNLLDFRLSGTFDSAPQLEFLINYPL